MLGGQRSPFTSFYPCLRRVKIVGALKKRNISQRKVMPVLSDGKNILCLSPRYEIRLLISNCVGQKPRVHFGFWMGRILLDIAPIGSIPGRYKLSVMLIIFKDILCSISP